MEYQATLSKLHFKTQDVISFNGSALNIAQVLEIRNSLLSLTVTALEHVSFWNIHTIICVLGLCVYELWQ